MDAADSLSQINCFIFVALYLGLKVTIDSPWISYDKMDFSEMDAIRMEKKALEEAEADHPKMPWWRRIIEKLLDE